MNLEALAEQAEGKPAPEPLLAVQAFANTIDVEEGSDLLESVASYAGWLRQMGLAAGGLKVSKGELKGARELRKAVRLMLTANEQDATDPGAARALARLAAEHPIPLTADESGRLTPKLGSAKSADELVSQLLAIIFLSQATDTWSRLKLCEDPECAWAFYDSSKNRSGSWCRAGQCGNRLKNRAYRERRRGGAKS
ncbi:MAG: zf-CGNR multi-domain protein [Solirubrobacterales bacterium]|nr:zf-CGNR multi-domain protein [Solirubrobacterales bacterium]